MKLYNILLNFALFCIVASLQICDGTISGSSSNECSYYDLPEGAHYCCYGYTSIEKEGKTQEMKRCLPLTEEQYKNTDEYIGELVKDFEKQGYKVNDFTIECGDTKNICDAFEGNNYNECKNHPVPPGKAHCCYLHGAMERSGEKKEEKGCASYSEEEYKNIYSIVENMRKYHEERGYTVTDMTLDCGQTSNTSNGNYIQFSILALLFLLLN